MPSEFHAPHSQIQNSLRIHGYKLTKAIELLETEQVQVDDAVLQYCACKCDLEVFKFLIQQCNFVPNYGRILVTVPNAEVFEYILEEISKRNLESPDQCLTVPMLCIEELLRYKPQGTQDNLAVKRFEFIQKIIRDHVFHAPTEELVISFLLRYFETYLRKKQLREEAFTACDGWLLGWLRDQNLGQFPVLSKWVREAVV